MIRQIQRLRTRMGLDALHSTSRDLIHAARSLAKDRGFTLVCVISLGIGMGALVALATFSRTVTAPARGIDTNGLVELLVLPLGPLRAKAGVWALEQWSFPDYQALRDADIGMDVTGWTRDVSQVGVQTSDGAAPPRVATLYVSANYFRTFGVSLARGQGFDPAIDDAPGAEPRVVLSHDFWQSRMAADPQIIGKSVTVDGVPHTVVGITPVDFMATSISFRRRTPCCSSPSSGTRACARIRRFATTGLWLGYGSTDDSTQARTSGRRTRWCRQRSLVLRASIPHRTNSSRPPSSRTSRWVRPDVRSRGA